MLNTVKFSQFATVNLANTTNMLVGVSSPSGGTNFQQPATVSWTTANRPGTPYDGLLGYNTSLSQWEYWNGSAWVQFASGGSGSVNTGDANQLGYYASSGTAISGLNSANNSVLTTNSSGVPSWETSLPSGLTMPIPNITGVTNGTNANAGSVGEYIYSQRINSSAISITDNNPSNVAIINLTSGDWNVWGNVFFNISSMIFSAYSAISLVSGTPPDLSLVAQQQSNSDIITGSIGIVAPGYRISVNTTTPVYLIGESNFSSGTVTASGIIQARRIR